MDDTELQDRDSSEGSAGSLSRVLKTVPIERFRFAPKRTERDGPLPTAAWFPVSLVVNNPVRTSLRHHLFPMILSASSITSRGWIDRMHMLARQDFMAGVS